MSKFIVEKKGVFGAIYPDTGFYLKHPTTTKDKNNAHKFSNLKDAQKVANKIKGEVIEIKEQLEAIREYNLVHCKECSYYDSINCRRTNMPADSNDYCSRGLKEYKKLKKEVE